MAIVTSVGTSLNLSLDNTAALKGRPALLRLLGDFQLSLDWKYGFLQIVALAALIYFYRKFLPAVDRRQKYWTLALSGVFALGIVLGYSFIKTNSWSLFFGGTRAFAKSSVALAGYWILLYVVLTGLYRFLVSRDYARLGEPTSRFDHLFAWTRSSFLRLWGIIFASWIVYLILFYPASGNPDTACQIANTLGYHDSAYYHLSEYLRDTSSLSDAHPVFVTVLYGVFTRAGVALGSLNAGLFAYSIAQGLWVSGVFAFALVYLRRLSLPLPFLKAAFLVLCLFPVIPLDALHMVKQVLYATIILLYMLMMVDFMRHPDRRLASVRWIAGFAALILLQMLTLKGGVYIFVISFIPFLLVYRKHWKKLVPLYVVPILVFQFLYTGLLLPALHISPGDPKEMYGIPFQQTARYVRDYPNDVTPHEKAVLSQVFDYGQIAKVYSPGSADPLKNDIYNYAATPADLRAYFRVWAEMGAKRPLVYAQAHLNTVYGYLDPDAGRSFLWFDLKSSYGNRVSGYTNGDYKILVPQVFRDARLSLQYVMTALAQVPGIGLFFMGAIWIWILLASSVFLVIRRQSRYFLVMLPLLGNFGMCLLAPANANYRYTMPFILCAVAVIGVTLLAFKQANELDAGTDPLAPEPDADAARPDDADPPAAAAPADLVPPTETDPVPSASARRAAPVPVPEPSPDDALGAIGTGEPPSP